MDRRTFLFRAPVAAVGGIAATVSTAEIESPEQNELRGILERATNSYETARNIIHWPAKYAEARPLLETSLEDAAEVWLRLRGVSRTHGHATWSFTACNVKDDITGVAWDRSRIALIYMKNHCDHIAEWRRRDPEAINTWGILQDRARRELSAALNCVAQCIECARHSLHRQTGPLPPLPPIPKNH